MKAVLQRVSNASVRVDDKTIGAIDSGFLILLGIAKGDTQEDLIWLVQKVAALRVFQDDAGKMNLSLADIGGSILLISQFTLLADCRKGRRPSFDLAGEPEVANAFYEKAAILWRDMGFHVEMGSFGSHMQVSLLNDGPVTLLIDTVDRPRKKV